MRVTFFKIMYLTILTALCLIAPSLSFAKGDPAKEIEISLVDGIAIRPSRT